MRLNLMSAALAAAVACVPFALRAEIDAAKGQAVIGMLRAYGCTLNAAQVDMFMGDMGTTPAEYAEILADAVARGFATGDAAVPGGVTLTPALCGLQHAAPADVLQAVLRYNGCQMSRDEAPVLLPPVGFMPDTVGPVIGELMSAGTLMQEGDLLKLSEAACAG